MVVTQEDMARLGTKLHALPETLDAPERAMLLAALQPATERLGGPSDERTGRHLPHHLTNSSPTQPGSRAARPRPSTHPCTVTAVARASPPTESR
jgi:hypothetical protein